MARMLIALAPLIALAAPASSQATDAPTVPIALSSFRIMPGVIHLAAGRPVRLAFTNLSGASHDFTAPAFFGRAQLLSGMAPRGEVDLPGHGQALVTLVPAPGTYRARCTHFGHALLGMKAVIVVD